MNRLIVKTRADDGSTEYELEAPEGTCRFTVKRYGPWTWGCSEGINWLVDRWEAERCVFLREGEPRLTATCREDGWLTFGPYAFRRVRRKLLRTAMRENRRRARDRQLETRGAPDYLALLEREALEDLDIASL